MGNLIDTYDAVSQRIATNRYNDLNSTDSLFSTNYTYDENGRLTDLTHLNNSDAIAAFDYTYDADNRITEIASNEGLSIFNYDDTDQLTEASHDHQEDEEYTYDDSGNRINDGYDTGENNQLLTDGVYNYSYDGEGNRTSQTAIATGEVTEYEWDYRNRLTGVITKNGSGDVVEAIEYTYDVNDNIIAKSVDLDGDGAGEAEVERYVLDGSEIAFVFDGDGNETERYFHGVGIDEVLAVEKANDEVIWALADHQGTVRVLMDNTGAVVNQISYDSFGNVTAQTNAGESFRFTYTGREFDSETGQYYYRARYYDSQTGLFISEDPIGFDGGDNNLYRYVGNSPINYSDPSGLLRIDLRDFLDLPIIGDLPGIEKLTTIEFNTGEGYAEDALEYYANIIADPDSPGYQKAMAYLGGGLAALWTCETSTKTFNTLTAALSFNKLASTTKISDIKNGLKGLKSGRNDRLRNRANNNPQVFKKP